MEEEFAKVMGELEQHRSTREDPNSFYVACADYYKDGSQKHNSPTKRLINQKNTTFEHKAVLNTNVQTGNYNQFYSSPGKSYIIEPHKGEINYKLAKKDINKFYEKVFNEEVTQHKVKNESPLRRQVSTKVTTRPHLKIMKKLRIAIALILKKKIEALGAPGNTDDILKALAMPPIKSEINAMVQEDEIMLVGQDNKAVAV